MTTRPTLPTTFTTREQYLSVLQAKIPGQADWSTLGQGRVASPAQESTQKQYMRLGDKTEHQRSTSVRQSASVAFFVEDNWEETAMALGWERPSGGWLGTEEIKLDPDKAVDFRILNYDVYDTSTAVHKTTEYLNYFRPNSFAAPWEADGDARVATIDGSLDDYYMIPEASV